MVNDGVQASMRAVIIKEVVNLFIEDTLTLSFKCVHRKYKGQTKRKSRNSINVKLPRGTTLDIFLKELLPSN